MAVIPPAFLLVHFLGFSYAHLVRPLRAARNPYLAGLGDSEPLIPTYLEYLKGMLRFDFGSMPATRQLGMGMIPVTKSILHASNASLGLMGLALIVSIFIGIMIGLSATRVNPPSVARWLSSVSTVGLAMPSIYLGSLFFAGWFLYIIVKGPGTQPLLLPIDLGRLLKMQTARKNSNQKIFQDEKYHLGADSDNFLRAISNRPILDESDLSLYLRISEILIDATPEEELDHHVESLITDLRTKVLDSS